MFSSLFLGCNVLLVKIGKTINYSIKQKGAHLLIGFFNCPINWQILPKLLEIENSSVLVILVFDCFK